MGKHNGNRKHTKVLFKKSNITIRTHSRTCSDASGSARSGILQIQNKISKTKEYYKDGDKLKRDLSVETGFCVLRRYYKSKHKKDTALTSSAKSRCSIEAGPDFTEFKPDHACGDSRNKFEVVQTHPLNIDITSLMVDNLKSLLNDWIRKQVMEDTETKTKFINVLDSILHSLDVKVSSTHSTCSTYIVERNGEECKVCNKRTSTNSVTCQYCQQKQTSLIADTRSSEPFPYRHMRIISTLSIPRNMYKKKREEKKSVYKVKKPQKKNAVVKSIKNERIVVINVSSGLLSKVSKKEMLEISKGRDKQKENKKEMIFLPQVLYNSTTDCTSNTEFENDKKIGETTASNMNTMPSLVKSIYADDPANITSTDKIINIENRNDNFTMTETNFSRHNSTKLINSISINTTDIYENLTKIDYRKQGIEFLNLAVQTPNNGNRKSIKAENKTKKLKACKKRKKICRRQKLFHLKSSPILKNSNIKHEHFTYLYRQSNNRRRQKSVFLNHFCDFLKYFSNYEGKRNIKLDINCNVYPFFDIEDKVSNTETKSFQEYDIKSRTTDIFDMEISAANNASGLEETKEMTPKVSTELNPDIIPILDGAASQAKYIFRSDNSTSISAISLKKTDIIERGTIMTGLEVSKELKELKSAIKDLAATAQLIVKEHLNRRKEETKIDAVPATATTTTDCGTKKVSTVINNINNKPIRQSNISRGLQFSNTAAKCQLMSGIRLSKGPSKKVEDATSRFKKRSSSYHVIDSESILKVTDMTTCAAKSNESTKPCALRKSKSLLNITNELNRQKLIAFFCDDCSKKKERICTNNPNNSCSNTQTISNPRCESQSSPCNMSCANSVDPSKLKLPVQMAEYQGCKHEYCSSVYVDIDKPTITVKKKTGLPLWEGCLYCILLWIPLIVIVYFFYKYVLKVPELPANITTTTTRKTPKLILRSLPESADLSMSRSNLRLSDFGF